MRKQVKYTALLLVLFLLVICFIRCRQQTPDYLKNESDTQSGNPGSVSKASEQVEESEMPVVLPDEIWIDPKFPEPLPLPANIDADAIRNKILTVAESCKELIMGFCSYETSECLIFEPTYEQKQALIARIG